ncbi:hypothetical protein BGX34_007674, partial [Mortierella sp. NVP85]
AARKVKAISHVPGCLKTIDPIVQLFKTIFSTWGGPNVSVHSTTADCLKQLVTHCMMNETIDIAVQKMRRNRGQLPENKHKVIDTIFTIKAVSTFAFEVPDSKY